MGTHSWIDKHNILTSCYDKKIQIVLINNYKYTVIGEELIKKL